MATVNKSVGARQSLTSPATITLPKAAYPDQSVWYAVSGVSSLEISYSSGADGILVTEDGILGPFRLANAPRFVEAGSANILVLVS